MSLNAQRERMHADRHPKIVHEPLSATLSEFERGLIYHGVIHRKHDEQQGRAHIISLFRFAFNLHANADVYTFIKRKLS